MNFCKSRAATYPTVKIALFSALALLTVGQPASSQTSTERKNPLTPKYVIGDAVSLSAGKSYPNIEKAIQRFRNSDVTGAQEFLKKAKEKNSKLAPADVMMAKMMLLTRNSRAIQVSLERATTNHVDDPEAYLMFADLAFASQRTTDAFALFEYAAPLVEKFTGNNKRKRSLQIKVVAGRAAIAERRAQWTQANALLDQWLTIEPENAVAHTRKGIVLFRLDKAKESLAEFKKAREINPNSAHPFVSLGQLFYAGGEVEKARKSYEKAYNENKADDKVAQAYAEWLIQERELGKAQEIATALREKTPNSITALLMDGIVSYMQGQVGRAEEALQKVLSLDPRNARATDLLAMLLIESDQVEDRERALQYAQLNAERLPNSAQANVTRAYVLYELGRKKEANDSLAKAGKMQIQPDSTYLIAKILVAEKQTDKAIEALKKIVAQKSRLVIFRAEAEKLLSELQAKAEAP